MFRATDFVVIFSLAAVVSLSGCTNKTEKVIEQKQAPENILKSFSAGDCERQSCVKIQKSSIGKVFLLIASGKTAGATPQWYDLKPLVVSFEYSGGKIALLAQNYLSIYKEISTVNLIQSFDVVTEDEHSITFDWGGGLRSLIAQPSYDTDMPRGEDGESITESSFRSIPVIDSFTRNIVFDEKNIELEQISKIRSDLVKSSGGSVNYEVREETIALNIQIRSYNLGDAFRRKESDRSRRVGFFVTKASREKMSNEVVNLITKWDIDPKKGPILVRISSAVPQQYVQAVSEGVLYWNRVFGYEVIKVKTDVDPQAGPQDRSIMIHWIPWLDAGAAYAIGQSDPLTGEVLRAQVFMPEVFTKVGSAELVQLNDRSPVVGNGIIACDFAPALRARNVLAKEASDSQRLRLAQDSVRSTIAHELGHALGLRHNFAGSFSAKVSTKEIYDAAKTYLKNPQHTGLETSTSIMDYLTGIDDVLLSARIKHSALSYDKMAMEWAYGEDSEKSLDESISAYCSDEDIGLANSQGLEIYGCERFDSGNNPLLRKYLEAKEEKENLAKTLFASIIGRLYPGDKPQEIANIDQVIADTVKWGRVNLEGLQFVQKAVVTPSANGIKVGFFASRQAIKSGQVYLSKLGLDSSFIESRDANLKEAGGYSQLLNQFIRNESGSIDAYWFDRQLADLERSGVLDKGTTLSGRSYALSSADKEKILKFFADVSRLNKKALITELEKFLPFVGKNVPGKDGNISVVSMALSAGMVSSDDAQILANIVLDLLRVGEGVKELKVGSGNGVLIKVPTPFITTKELLPFRALLSTEAVGFAQEINRASVKHQIAGEINKVLTTIDPNLDITKVPASEQATLLNKLFVQGLLEMDGVSWLTEKVVLLNAL